MTEIFAGDVGIFTISNIKKSRISCRTECSPFIERDAIVDAMVRASICTKDGVGECQSQQIWEKLG